MINSTRSQKALLGIFTGILQYVFTIVLQFILSPLILKYAGSDVLGAYSFLMQMVSWAALSDLGFGTSVGRFLAQSLTLDGKREEFIKVFTTGRTYYIFSNILFSLVILIFNFNLEKILITSSSILQECHYSLILLSIWIVIRTPLSLYNDSLIATQNLFSVNIITTIGAIVRLVLSLVFVIMRADLVGLMFANIFSEFITSLLCYIVYRKKFSFDKFGWGLPDKDLFRSMLGFGFSYMLVMLSSRLSSNTDSIIIGTLFGTTAVAIFYTSQMPGTMLSQVIWKIVDNSAPAINELYSKSLFPQLISVYFRILKYSLLFAFPLGIGIVCYNRIAISLWVGESQYAGDIFTLALALFIITQVIIHLNCVFLIALGKVKVMSYSFIFTGILKVTCSYFLARSIGISGIMVSSAIVDMIECIFLIKVILKHLEISYNQIFIDALYPSLKACIFLVLTPITSFFLPSINDWSEFILSASFFLVLWLLGAIIFGLINAERANLYIFLKDKLYTYTGYMGYK
jgi:O-antigen/teichoic acid export membrane protein